MPPFYLPKSHFLSNLLLFCSAICSHLAILAQPDIPIAIEVNQLRQNIARAPQLRDLSTASAAPIVSLPLPKGGAARYRVYESPVLDEAMSVQYPDIKTYAMRGIDDPTATGRFALTSEGLDALILTEKGNVFIRRLPVLATAQPADNRLQHPDSDRYQCYYEHQLPADNEISACSAWLDPHIYDPEDGLREGSCGDNGIFGKNYRLVVSTTGEFTAQHGGTLRG